MLARCNNDMGACNNLSSLAIGGKCDYECICGNPNFFSWLLFSMTSTFCTVESQDTDMRAKTHLCYQEIFSLVRGRSPDNEFELYVTVFRPLLANSDSDDQCLCSIVLEVGVFLWFSTFILKCVLLSPFVWPHNNVLINDVGTVLPTTYFVYVYKVCIIFIVETLMLGWLKVKDMGGACWLGLRS